MLLLELFTQTYPIAVTKVTPNHYESKFWDPVALVPVTFAADWYPQSNCWNIIFSRGRDTFITGQGNAYKIFGTIIECIRQFIERKQPPQIEFQADDLSRQHLYMSMIKRLANDMGYQYTPTSDKTNFVLVRITK